MKDGIKRMIKYFKMFKIDKADFKKNQIEHLELNI